MKSVSSRPDNAIQIQVYFPEASLLCLNQPKKFCQMFCFQPNLAVLYDELCYCHFIVFTLNPEIRSCLTDSAQTVKTDGGPDTDRQTLGRRNTHSFLS